MKIRNMREELVDAILDSVCNDIEKDPAYKGICICEQCRTDAACYALNRMTPHYIASSRGLVREELFSFVQQQEKTDLITLLIEGFTKVAHNSRPNRSHKMRNKTADSFEKPIFNVPSITGRILDGRNFAPVINAEVGLYLNDTLIAMKNENWQNPCLLNEKTEGTFTFWPSSIDAPRFGEQKTFDFSVHIQAEGFDAFQHCFSVPVISERVPSETLSLENTVKLPNLYMFPPEEETC